ncbi:hypothetical protein GE09DRAFT_1159545 [Coniochaeta sp. 2T2.1]|nr:hypothetical protein GE09DRAFT_1159545 [Coniochaeta sp. 2T2.1]
MHALRALCACQSFIVLIYGPDIPQAYFGKRFRTKGCLKRHKFKKTQRLQWPNSRFPGALQMRDLQRALSYGGGSQSTRARNTQEM